MEFDRHLADKTITFYANLSRLSFLLDALVSHWVPKCDWEDFLSINQGSESTNSMLKYWHFASNISLRSLIDFGLALSLDNEILFTRGLTISNFNKSSRQNNLDKPISKDRRLHFLSNHSNFFHWRNGPKPDLQERMP